MIPDDLAEAVLAREDVVRYLQSSHGGSDGRERVFAYLEELKTTQRYPFYRALKHPLYPILRKIDRHVEHLDIVQAATRAGRVIYASNQKHKPTTSSNSVLLDAHGYCRRLLRRHQSVRRCRWADIHRTGPAAIPICGMECKDPAYLVDAQAYVAEFAGGATTFCLSGRRTQLQRRVKSPRRMCCTRH